MPFYVYILYRPWDMTPCYVGKGKGNRVRDHARHGAEHRNGHLRNLIKKAGGALPFEIVLETSDEETAFAEEIRLIRIIGRADLRLGPLCNLTDGGEGTSGRVQSDEEKAARSEHHQSIWDQLDPKERLDRMRPLHGGLKNYWESLSLEDRKLRLKSAQESSAGVLRTKYAGMTEEERVQSTTTATRASQEKWQSMPEDERAELNARRSAGMKNYLATLSADQKQARTAAAVARRMSQRAERINLKAEVHDG